MKIVAILGSPHGMKGSTGQLLEGLLQGANKAGAKITTFSLAELKVKPCVSCEQCHITGKCPIKDDFNTIKEAITKADGLVLASPNYVLGVTAQMKALLDRLSGPIHTQEFNGKYAAAVVTAGSEFAEVGEYLLHAMRIIGFTTVGSVGALGRQMMSDATRAPQLTAAVELGSKLVAAIREKQRFPEQEEERRNIRARFRQLVSMQKDHWKYEYEYWQKQP